MIGPDDIENDEEREFDIDIGGDTEEVEVDVAEPTDEAEPTAEAEPEAEAPAEEPKRRGRLDERLAALARRAAEAEARAEAAERQRGEYEQRLTTAESSQFAQMESAISAELATAKRELVDAKTLGDYSAEADATAKMAKLAADLSAVQAYRATPQQPRQEQRQQREATPQERSTQAWVATNTWFNPKSADHDEELAAEAQHFARKLEIKLKREGKSSAIGDADYFAAIDAHMAKEFPDFFDEPPVAATRKTPNMKAGTDVAPVGRQGSPLQPAKKSNIVKLSAAERQMAEAISPHLPAQQAWATYARNK